MIKAAQVSGPGDVRDLERFHVDFHLLDARSQAPEHAGLRGGTGETFDWTLLAARRSKVPLILSGGLRRRERERGDRTDASLCGRHGQRHRVARRGARTRSKLRAFFDATAAAAAPADLTPDDATTRSHAGASADDPAAAAPSDLSPDDEQPTAAGRSTSGRAA